MWTGSNTAQSTSYANSLMWRTGAQIWWSCALTLKGWQYLPFCTNISTDCYSIVVLKRPFCKRVERNGNITQEKCCVNVSRAKEAAAPFRTLHSTHMKPGDVSRIYPDDHMTEHSHSCGIRYLDPHKGGKSHRDERKKMTANHLINDGITRSQTSAKQTSNQRLLTPLKLLYSHSGDNWVKSNWN